MPPATAPPIATGSPVAYYSLSAAHTGALLAAPVAMLPGPVMTGFLAFGLISLLYLVTEELLVDAHETPDRPWVTAMFFAGFLILLVIEELMS